MSKATDSYSLQKKNMGKNLRSKYVRKLLDITENVATNALKTVSKTAIQKTSEATNDMVGNKIVGKISKVDSNCTQKVLKTT